jgi:Flp pilus assembly CpaE family ATPase
VVVDVGAGLERDDEALLDPGLPVRHGAAITTLGLADRVLAVSGPDAISLVRLGRGLETVTTLAPTAPCDVVVNRVRRSVVGLRPEPQVRDVIASFGAHRTFVVPDDPRAWDAALLSGQTLAEAVPGSVSRRALQEVVDVELPRSARHRTAPRHRRLLAR